MLPGGGLLSAVPVPSEFLAPRDRPYNPLVSYEFGGPALNTPVQSRLVRIWAAYYESGTVYVAPEEGGAATALFSDPTVETLSLGFDQNMRPTIAYMTGGVMKLRWFDAIANDTVTTTWPNVTSGQVTCDDKRDTTSGSSDVVFVYTEDNKLYYRMQRERYTVPHLLFPAAKGKVLRIGMSVNNRLQIEVGEKET